MTTREYGFHALMRLTAACRGPLLVFTGLVFLWCGVSQASTEYHLVLLPLQDRAADPETAELVESAIRDALSERGYSFPDANEVRDTLRRKRIRDSSSILPSEALLLQEELGADKFFSSTLHFVSGSGTPRITLSGRVFQAGRPTLVWAGFHSGSGLDRKRWLGLGGIEDMEVLCRVIADHLVSSFDDPEASEKKNQGSAKDVFLGRNLTPEVLGTVAVVPFDSVTERDAALVGEAVTSLALAVLHRRGISVALPGSVEEILRRRGVYSQGSLDVLSRAGVRATSGANSVFTGTVEEYDLVRIEPEPQPAVAIGARILDADSGQILWMGGLERDGWDRRGLFGLSRVFAPGVLAETMMESLVSSFTDPKRLRESGSEVP